LTLRLAFLIPTILLWIVFFYRLFNSFGSDSVVPFAGWILGASLLSFTGSIAMIFVRPAERFWRYAAGFNALPFLAIILFAYFAG
jgi:hypothetical protein